MKCQGAYKPGSVPIEMGDDHSSRIRFATYLMQPTRTAMARRTILSLFGFAPDGVYLAASVARRSVRSYRTLSAFLRLFCKTKQKSSLLSVALSLNLHWPGVTRHPVRAGARTFLEPCIYKIYARLATVQLPDRSISVCPRGESQARHVT